MPRLKSVKNLEGLCLDSFCKICATTCAFLEENETGYHEEEQVFVNFLKNLPRAIVEQVITITVKIIAEKVRNNRSQKGLLKAVELLPQSSVQKLNLSPLFHSARLYGNVDRRLKNLIEDGLHQLPNLFELDLRSKCTDAMLVQVAKHCRGIGIINITLSDISDRGLLALIGSSMKNEVSKANGDGCPCLMSLNIHDCLMVTNCGVAALLKNLPKLENLHFDNIFEALEILLKMEPAFVDGSARLKITHLEQLNPLQENATVMFEAAARACPKIESVRMTYIDDFHPFLTHFSEIKHIQLELPSSLNEEFTRLTSQFGRNLISLHLTFKSIHASILTEMAKNCPNLESIRLFGTSVINTTSLKPNEKYFNRLKAFEARLLFEEHDMLFEDFNPNLPDHQVHPEFMHFFLAYSPAIQEITFSARIAFANENFLAEILSVNPMSELQRLCISPLNKVPGLTHTVAFNIIMALPNLSTLAVSRWSIRTREIANLKQLLKHQNIDVLLV